MGVDPEIACGIVGNIGQLWLDGQFNDLQIHVGDFLFDCNRFILCACSKFFKVLLKSEVKGEGEHPIRQVTIRGISPEIFQLVLKTVYQGENGLSTENMIKFWHAVHQLEIPFLISKCETFLSSHLTVENFVNIYQNALLLKSTNITKIAHHFVAKNLESFKELDILLQQPASYIEEIIGDDSLVGQSQNHVVEFILKWVNYELCASEGEHVSPDSTVEDLSAQTNEVTENKDDSVEVIFQKPCATFEDDNDRNLFGQSLVRKQFLGKLLKQVRFAEVNQDSLEMLSDNDLVMGSKETRDIVKQALKLVNLATAPAVSTTVTSTPAASITAASTPASSTTAASTTAVSIPVASPTAASTPAASTPACSIDTECVVFVSRFNISTIYAYSLDTGEIFQFLSPGSISNIQVHHNKLLCRVLCKSSPSEPYMLKMTEFPFSKEMNDICGVINDSVLVGNFCYTSIHQRRKPPSLQRRNIEDGIEWEELLSLPGGMPSPSLTVLNESILYYNNSTQGGKQEVYCLNTNSRNHWLMMTCDFVDCDFVTFTKDEKLYILYGNGICIDVTHHVISPVKAFSLYQYIKTPKSLLLWNFQFKIFGAVVYKDNLVVFGDLTSVSVSEIHDCKIPGLKAIKFVHLFGILTKCYPLVIPKGLLQM
ncbi:hypothetical protein BsWGS_24000 [Bradybaena similaris]